MEGQGKSPPLGKTDTNLLRELAQKYDKTVSQIALNYLVCQGAIPIPRSNNREHLLENLASLGWRLKKEDLEKIKQTPLSQEDEEKIFIPTDTDILRGLGLDVEEFLRKDLY